MNLKIKITFLRLLIRHKHIKDKRNMNIQKKHL